MLKSPIFININTVEISITQKIKQYLKTFPLLVKLKRAVWSLFVSSKPKPPEILTDRNYFSKAFSSSHNIKSITFDKGLVVGNFRGTSYFLNIRPQNHIESYVFLHELWEPHIAELIAGYLNEPKAAVVDVGANIGATSIPLAKHFPNVSFHLFEPHPIVFDDLNHNLSFNKLSNVNAKNVAITDTGSSMMPFYAQRNAKNFGLSSFTLNNNIEDYEVIQVKCEALDEILSDQICVKVIKVDTQGHELQVLRSAQKLIAKQRPVIFFEFESDYFSESIETDTKNEILRFFKELHYELYMLVNGRRFLPRVTLREYFHGDIIAVPLSINTSKKI